MDLQDETGFTKVAFCPCSLCGPIDAWTASFGSLEQIVEVSIPSHFRCTEALAQSCTREALAEFTRSVQVALRPENKDARVKALLEARWLALGALYGFPPCCVADYARKKIANPRHEFSLARRMQGWYMCDACYVLHRAETQSDLTETTTCAAFNSDAGKDPATLSDSLIEIRSIHPSSLRAPSNQCGSLWNQPQSPEQWIVHPRPKGDGWSWTIPSVEKLVRVCVMIGTSVVSAAVTHVLIKAFENHDTF